MERRKGERTERKEEMDGRVKWRRKKGERGEREKFGEEEEEAMITLTPVACRKHKTLALYLKRVSKDTIHYLTSFAKLTLVTRAS
jgi:hypothetical protein